jgi:methionyl-tRNA formyltransferase
MRTPEDGLIDWNKPSHSVYNFIRAQSEPYPGAFTIFEGKKLIIWKAHPSPITYYGTPGQVAKASHEGVYVICGDNTPLVCDFVEYDGKKDTASKTIKSIKTRFGH